MVFCFAQAHFHTKQMRGVMMDTIKQRNGVEREIYRKSQRIRSFTLYFGESILTFVDLR